MLQNDKSFSKRYYARHIKEGLVHYYEDGKDNLYLVTNEALKKMNESFEGKPLFVRHVDKINMNTLKEDKVGEVVKSFYNEFDGAWWAEIMADDEAQSYIEKGWAVSNAYLPTEYGGGGVYHDIDYQKEVKNGTYGHLALVDNPRYEEAVIMTPAEFKKFNEDRKQELEQLKNSKENEMLSKEDMDALVASVQNSVAAGLTETIKETVKNAIEEKIAEDKKNAEDEDHRKLIREIAAISAKEEGDFEGGLSEKVKTIIGLAEKLGYSKDEAKENACGKNEDEEKAEEKENAEEEKPADNACKNAEDEEKKEEEPKENADDADDKKEEEPAKEKENSKSGSFFEALKNAKQAICGNKVSTMATGLKLGKDRYGKK